MLIDDALTIAVRALERIRDHEIRADRRKRDMVDVDEIATLRLIATGALQTIRKGGKA